MKNFKQLQVWQKGFRIAVNSIRFVKDFSAEEKFGLASQITSAAISIPSNIAEGSSRASEKDYARFIQISLGSAYELETQVLIAEAVDYGAQGIRNDLLKDVIEEQRMLVGFLSRLKK